MGRLVSSGVSASLGFEAHEKNSGFHLCHPLLIPLKIDNITLSLRDDKLSGLAPSEATPMP